MPSHSPVRAARLEQAEAILRQYINSLNMRDQNGANQPYRHTTERLQEKARADVHNQKVARLDMIFHALSDPTRRAMLADLRGGERSVADLAKPHAMSRTGASKHVEILARAGLVERRKSGRKQLCRLRAGPMGEADAWLRQFG